MAVHRPDSPRVLVVGAGISGIACARSLQRAQITPWILDRGRVVGGRMASRRLPRSGQPDAGHITDIGASYFTAREPEFLAEVETLVASGVVRPWTDTFAVAAADGQISRRTGPMRYAAPGGLRSVVAALAMDLPVVQGTDVSRVEADAGGRLLVDAGPPVAWAGEVMDAVALCMPGPQAHRLLAGTHPGIAAAQRAALSHSWEPVIAVSVGFAELGWQPFDGMFVNDDPTLTWIADDGARRGNGAPVLVAHLAPELAATCLDDPTQAGDPAVAAVRRVLDIEVDPIWVDVHRWTFARPTGAAEEPYFLEPGLGLGLAGDAWAGGPRVEAAWCSGRDLGRALAVHLDG